MYNPSLPASMYGGTGAGLESMGWGGQGKQLRDDGLTEEESG